MVAGSLNRADCNVPCTFQSDEAATTRLSGCLLMGPDAWFSRGARGLQGRPLSNGSMTSRSVNRRLSCPPFGGRRHSATWRAARKTHHSWQPGFAQTRLSSPDREC
jgi:hypothetical protein